MKLSSINPLIRLLIVIYLVGIIGLVTTSLRAYILPLTVYNLLLTFVCFLLGLGKLNSSRVLDILIIGVFGYTVEYVGVHTGYLFGDYHYGASLGPKVDGIPLVMSVNWIILCFCSCAVVWNSSKNNLIRAFLAAVLMTGLDFLIEPVTSQLDFWYWKDGHIPMYNYICWFGLSFFANYWICRRKSVVRNQVTVGVFILQSAFFGILCILL